MIERIERHVNSRGRDIIGWDEILDGGLAPNATVMSWRGEEGGIKAAQMGHDAIMTPGAYCYLDQYQDDPGNPSQRRSARPLLYSTATPTTPHRPRSTLRYTSI